VARGLWSVAHVPRAARSRFRFQARTSDASQTGVAASFANGSGKSGRCVQRVACVGEVSRIAVTSAKPASPGHLFPDCHDEVRERMDAYLAERQPVGRDAPRVWRAIWRAAALGASGGRLR